MKQILAAALAPAVLLLLGACAAPSSGAAVSSEQAVSSAQTAPEAATQESAAGYPVTVTNYDANGDPVELTFTHAPERVVAVYQGSIETMIALGLEDHVVASYGLDNEVKPEWQEGLAAMNYQADVFAPDRETVTLLQPDLILSWGSLFSDKMLGDTSYWNERGTATYMNSNTRPGGHPRTVDNEYADILNLGRIFGVEEKAEALVAGMQAEIDSTLAGDMVTRLGGTLANPDGHEMSKEDLLACDPDVIFVVYMAYSGDDPEQVVRDQLAVISEDPALRSLSAVQSGRVLPVMLGDIYAAGPRTLDGIRTLAAGMYPEEAS